MGVNRTFSFANYLNSAGAPTGRTQTWTITAALAMKIMTQGFTTTDPQFGTFYYGPFSEYGGTTIGLTFPGYYDFAGVATLYNAHYRQVAALVDLGTGGAPDTIAAVFDSDSPPSGTQENVQDTITPNFVLPTTDGSLEPGHPAPYGGGSALAAALYFQGDVVPEFPGDPPGYYRGDYPSSEYYYYNWQPYPGDSAMRDGQPKVGFGPDDPATDCDIPEIIFTYFDSHQENDYYGYKILDGYDYLGGGQEPGPPSQTWTSDSTYGSAEVSAQAVMTIRVAEWAFNNGRDGVIYHPCILSWDFAIGSKTVASYANSGGGFVPATPPQVIVTHANQQNIAGPYIGSVYSQCTVDISGADGQFGPLTFDFVQGQRHFSGQGLTSRSEYTPSGDRDSPGTGANFHYIPACSIRPSIAMTLFDGSPYVPDIYTDEAAAEAAALAIAHGRESLFASRIEVPGDAGRPPQPDDPEYKLLTYSASPTDFALPQVPGAASVVTTRAPASVLSVSLPPAPATATGANVYLGTNAFLLRLAGTLTSLSGASGNVLTLSSLPDPSAALTPTSNTTPLDNTPPPMTLTVLPGKGTLAKGQYFVFATLTDPTGETAVVHGDTATVSAAGSAIQASLTIPAGATGVNLYLEPYYGSGRFALSLPGKAGAAVSGLITAYNPGAGYMHFSNTTGILDPALFASLDWDEGGSLPPGTYYAAFTWVRPIKADGTLGETKPSPQEAASVVPLNASNPGEMTLPAPPPDLSWGSVTAVRSLPVLPAPNITVSPNDDPASWIVKSPYAGGNWAGVRFIRAAFRSGMMPAAAGRKMLLTAVQGNGAKNTFALTTDASGMAIIDTAAPMVPTMPAWGKGLGVLSFQPFYDANSSGFDLAFSRRAGDAASQLDLFGVTSLELSATEAGDPITLASLTFFDKSGVEGWVYPGYDPGNVHFCGDGLHLLADGKPAGVYLFTGYACPSGGDRIATGGRAVPASVQDFLDDMNALSSGWTWSATVVSETGPEGSTPPATTPDVVPIDLLTDRPRWSAPATSQPWPGSDYTFALERIISTVDFPFLGTHYSMAGKLIVGGGAEGLALKSSGQPYAGALSLTHSPHPPYAPKTTPRLSQSISSTSDANGFYRAATLSLSEAAVLKASGKGVKGASQSLPALPVAGLRAYDSVGITLTPLAGGDERGMAQDPATGRIYVLASDGATGELTRTVYEGCLGSSSAAASGGVGTFGAAPFLSILTGKGHVRAAYRRASDDLIVIAGSTDHLASLTGETMSGFTETGGYPSIVEDASQGVTFVFAAFPSASDASLQDVLVRRLDAQLAPLAWPDGTLEATVVTGTTSAGRPVAIKNAYQGSAFLLLHGDRQFTSTDAQTWQEITP